MTYDNGLPLALEEFENLTYARRWEMLTWMGAQKNMEQDQVDEAQSNSSK